MILTKDKHRAKIGDELKYRGVRHNITNITEQYIVINAGRTIKVAYDADGYPKRTENKSNGTVRIPMRTLNELGWSAKNG